MDFDEPIHPISRSSAIAGHTPATGRSWYAKGLLHSPKYPDRPAPVPGATTLVSGRSVLAHSIAVPLADGLGMHAEMACRAARRFTDLSSENEAPGFMRNPGELFDKAFTYLAAYPNGDVRIIRGEGIKKRERNKETGKVEMVLKKPSLDDILTGIGHRDGAWLLCLDFIVRHVEIELRKHAQGEAD